jgi:hypothetical protein
MNNVGSRIIPDIVFTDATGSGHRARVPNLINKFILFVYHHLNACKSAKFPYIENQAIVAAYQLFSYEDPGINSSTDSGYKIIRCCSASIIWFTVIMRT